MTIDIKVMIPMTDPTLQNFIEAFVFKCPLATVTSKKKAKYKTWDDVSARDCSFRTRGNSGILLNTITAQIKRQLKNGLYKKVGKDENVDSVFDADLSDEKIVLKRILKCQMGRVLLHQKCFRLWLF